MDIMNIEQVEFSLTLKESDTKENKEFYKWRKQPKYSNVTNIKISRDTEPTKWTGDSSMSQYSAIMNVNISHDKEPRTWTGDSSMYQSSMTTSETPEIEEHRRWTETSSDLNPEMPDVVEPRSWTETGAAADISLTKMNSRFKEVDDIQYWVKTGRYVELTSSDLGIEERELEEYRAWTEAGVAAVFPISKMSSEIQQIKRGQYPKMGLYVTLPFSKMNIEPSDHSRQGYKMSETILESSGTRMTSGTDKKRTEYNVNQRTKKLSGTNILTSGTEESRQGYNQHTKEDMKSIGHDETEDHQPWNEPRRFHSVPLQIAPSVPEVSLMLSKNSWLKKMAVASRHSSLPQREVGENVAFMHGAYSLKSTDNEAYDLAHCVESNGTEIVQNYTFTPLYWRGPIRQGESPEIQSDEQCLPFALKNRNVTQSEQEHASPVCKKTNNRKKRWRRRRYSSNKNCFGNSNDVEAEEQKICCFENNERRQNKSSEGEEARVTAHIESGKMIGSSENENRAVSNKIENLSVSMTELQRLMLMQNEQLETLKNQVEKLLIYQESSKIHFKTHESTQTSVVGSRDDVVEVPNSRPTVSVGIMTSQCESLSARKQGNNQHCQRMWKTGEKSSDIHYGHSQAKTENETNITEETLCLLNLDLPIIQEEVPSPMPSLHIDIEDFEDDDDENYRPSEYIKNLSSQKRECEESDISGFTFYDRVVGRVGEMLEDSAHANNIITQDTQGLYTKEGFERVPVELDVQTEDTSFRNTRRVSDELLKSYGCKMPVKNDGNEEDSSVFINTLAVKYLDHKEADDDHIKEHSSYYNISTKSPSFSISTENYFDRHNVFTSKDVHSKDDEDIKEVGDPHTKTGLHSHGRRDNDDYAGRKGIPSMKPEESCKNILDITMLKKQPKLL